MKNARVEHYEITYLGGTGYEVICIYFAVAEFPLSGNYGLGPIYKGRNGRDIMTPGDYELSMSIHLENSEASPLSTNSISLVSYSICS